MHGRDMYTVHTLVGVLSLHNTGRPSGMFDHIVATGMRIMGKGLANSPGPSFPGIRIRRLWHACICISGVFWKKVMLVLI